MKLEPVFTVKDNKLFKISDDSAIDITVLKRIEVKWSTVEIEEETYNEEYLAALREELKVLDNQNAFAILVPVVDKPLETPEQVELFINAYNHTARRVKDCVSVAGYELPDELLKFGLNTDSASKSFTETIAIKHAQYVYFANSENVNKYNLAENMQNEAIVIY